MAAASFSSLFFMLLFHLPIYSAEEVSSYDEACPPSSCGDVEIKLPFSQNQGCGFYAIECTEPESIPKIQFEKEGRQYVVKNISYTNNELTIQDDQFSLPLLPTNCGFLNSFIVPLFNFTLTSPELTFFKCMKNFNPPESFRNFQNYTLCREENIYYTDVEDTPPLENPPPGCSIVQYPVPRGSLPRHGQDWSNDDFLALFSAGFSLNWENFPDCFPCQQRGGRCDLNQATQSFRCNDSRKPNVKRKVIVGVCAGVGSFLMACFLCFFYYRRRGKRLASSQSTLLSSNYPSDSSLKRDLEKGSSNNFFTHIFSYKELEEATNNFDSSKELGDGGFGTVYHGKLRDGRSVAVKRLYENNYKRVEQFMNEVAILSGLRHQNLVSLYGCTSRHSRELLLVYEYVPNGTVADHLHGDRAKPEAPLTWPIRLSIAIETSEALSYLHAIEPQIIHRDVKTNNILLDSNFHVKVADFGLSRLFPMDVTHVSTAPQGTPGYVDPDYHQCYQLTDKSDVYSFGVVLMELISSMPAVDISRHRHEINLATMAMNKIQNQALHDLVDPKLGCESDSGVRRMVTLVAELGFRCLQLEKDMRPSMEEVVEILRGIESEGYQKVEKLTADSPSVADDAVLLKSVVPYSPNSVMEKLSSRSTTPNASG